MSYANVQHELHELHDPNSCAAKLGLCNSLAAQTHVSRQGQ